VNIRFVHLTVLLALAVALAACGGDPTPPGAQTAETTAALAGPVPAAAVVLAQDYENAISVRNQLLIGAFRLEETPLAVTPQQAAELLPLWQMLRALAASGTASQSETDAVLSQIQHAMSAEQLQAIRDMRLTGEDNQALMESLGVTSPQGMGLQPGQGANLSEAERATRRAEGVASGGASGGSVVLDKIIELLESKKREQ